MVILWSYLNSCISIFAVWVKLLCSWICNIVGPLLWSVHAFIVIHIRWILISLCDTINEIHENWYTTKNSEFTVYSYCFNLTYLVCLYDPIVVRYSITYGISVYHYQRCEFEFRPWGGVLDTTVCDKVCQWLAVDQRTSPCALISPHL